MGAQEICLSVTCMIRSTTHYRVSAFLSSPFEVSCLVDYGKHAENARRDRHTEA